MLLKRGIAVAGLVLGSACTTLGPDYVEPRLDWLEAWQTNLYGEVVDPELHAETDLQFWWHIFDDPVLNQLIDVAKAENPGLRIAGLRIIESRALLGIAVGSRYPQQQQITGSATVARNSGSAGGGDRNVRLYDVGASVGWEADFWGRFRRSIESADAAFFASITNQQDVQVLLSAQLVDLYFAYRTIERRIAIAHKNATIQERSLEITRKLYDSGQQAELDVQQATTQYLATVASIPALQSSHVQLANAIGALLGRAPGDLPELLPSVADLPLVEPQRIAGIPAQLLLRRPDVRTSAWQVAAQSARIGVAQADLYPRISLFGTVGWSGDSIDGSSDTTSFAAGPVFTWNVLNYGRLKNAVRVQDARLQQAIAGYENTLLQAAREIDSAAIDVVKTREQQIPLRQSVAAAERSLQLATARYREGYADFQRVLEAQRALAAQSESQIVNLGLHLSAVVDFYTALGGGWQLAGTADLLPAETRDTMRSRSDWGELLETPLPPVPATPASE